MLKQYTRAQLAAMEKELETVGPALAAMAVDYGKLRDQVRACRGAK